MVADADGAALDRQPVLVQHAAGERRREDLPVFPGTDFPKGTDESSLGELSAFYEGLRYLTDSDSYGAVHFYENLSSGALNDENSARDFLLASANKYPGRVTVIAIGPVMNIARAVEADPAFAKKIASVWYMSGAFSAPYASAYADGEPVQAVGGANITPFAEYNACYDASSLKTCLTAGFPVQVLMPGEISAALDEETVARLESENAGRDGLAGAWLERYAVSLPDYPYWDPVTAMAFLQSENLTKEECYVTVCTDRNDPHYAMTSSVTPAEYALLSEEEQAGYGKAFVGREYRDFWAPAVRLLCR